MSAIAVLLIAHSALAGSRQVPPLPPPRVQQRAVPVRAPAPPNRSVQQTQSGARGNRGASVISQPIAPPPAPQPPRGEGEGQHRHRHHHRQFYGPNCEGGSCAGYGYEEPPPDAYGVDAPPVERWDDPVDESVAGFDDDDVPAEPPPPPEPAAKVDCDGGATDFQVDDGTNGPAFYRWVDRDGSVNYTDEASVPDWARAKAKKTSGDPITIAPRGVCQGAARSGN